METASVARPVRRSRSNPKRMIFTLLQANRALPLVQRIVADIVRQYKKVCALEERCHIRRPNVTEEEQGVLRRDYTNELFKLRNLSEELRAVGCELKDWRMGLVDFLSIHDGREVELCWRLGEERIEYWHDIETGFSGRQLVDESFGGTASPRPQPADVGA